MILSLLGVIGVFGLVALATNQLVPFLVTFGFVGPILFLLVAFVRWDESF